VFVQSDGVFGVGLAKASVNFGARIAAIANRIITKVCIAFGTANDGPVFCFRLRPKFFRRDIVPILQCENKTLQTVIRLLILSFERLILISAE
jgi:hypothetical protein